MPTTVNIRLVENFRKNGQISICLQVVPDFQWPASQSNMRIFHFSCKKYNVERHYIGNYVDIAEQYPIWSDSFLLRSS